MPVGQAFRFFMGHQAYIQTPLPAYPGTPGLSHAGILNTLYSWT